MNGKVDFLYQVWGQQRNAENSYFCLSTKRTSDGRWQDHFVQLDEVPAFFRKYRCRNYDIYYCPTPLKEPRRLKENVTGSKYLWADLDEVEVEEVEPPPTLLVESSPGRYQCLWKLRRFQSAEKIEELNRALTYANDADNGGWDLTQVLRIPGTKNHKYKSAPTVKLISSTRRSYRFHDLRRRFLLDTSTEHPTQSSDPTGLDRNEVYNQWKSKIDARTKQYLHAKSTAGADRSKILWSIEHKLLDVGLSPDEIIALIQPTIWNKYRGRRDEVKRLHEELSKIIAGTFTDPDSGSTNKVNGTGIGSISRMSDIMPEHVSWLWYPYVPRGKLTLLEGDPGLGKSWASLVLATSLSRGDKLPGQTRATRGRSLFLCAEDGLADTIRPRLDSLNANTNLIFAFEKPFVLDEENLQDFDLQLAELRPSLVIIDPLVAYMGAGIDLHKANETRMLMARLGSLAEQYNCAIVAVRHLTKGNRDRSIYRGIGSIDLTAAARSVLLITADPEEPDTCRILYHIKSNLAPVGKPQGYSLAKGQFKWTGESDHDLDEALASTGNKAMDKENERAVEFLKEMLAEGGMNVKDLTRQAESRGIRERSLKRAKSALNVEARKTGRFNWTWSLP